VQEIGGEHPVEQTVGGGTVGHLTTESYAGNWVTMRSGGVL
jgi:hypothetical protein